MTISERRTFFWFSRNHGQFPLMQAVRLSLGRTFRSKESAINTALWGLGVGTLYLFVSPPQYRVFNFCASILIAISIGYFSRISWRWRIVRGTDAQIMTANALVALIWGYVMAFGCFLLAMMLCQGLSGFTPEFFRIVRLVSTCSFVFPIIGYYAVLGEEHQRRARRLLHAKAYQEKLAEQARAVALRAQINPHFFFNALNTVAALIPTRPADAERAIELLATALRPVLTRDQPLAATLESELGVARAYAEIEQLRLGHRVKFVFEISDEAAACALPGLSLQPLLENAVRHGAMSTTENYRIETSASIVDGYLIVMIRSAPEESFDRALRQSMVPAKVEKGHALHNITSRLRSLCGPRAGLVALVSDDGLSSIATMRLPR